MNCIDEHFIILRKRFNDRRLKEAAERRAGLAYESIKIGDKRGSGRVKFLLAQMHQNYYFGYFETACTLAGIILEQGLVFRISNWISERGPILFKRKKENSIWIQNREQLLELDLIGLLFLAEKEKILDDRRLILVSHQIRWIRNMVVHDRMPYFRDTGKKNLEMKVLKSRKKPVKYATIKLDAEEVRNIKKPGGEITAYFCISRVREVLKVLLGQNNKKKLEKEKNHENGSYLFRW
ncbi:MAG: hypothetical protein J7K04_08655 [Spirochaetales bacterium]|nr:hypothetical protein [Spirochaetales bacterium]